eukprot:CAMPEP_0201147790 /NCGR_PEP_ID=MMETSP0851-20130426/9302_1 /ASSEMBLY_ACC=CAM_ASM_000631 /TAXON_ID=183588 /ORGANISM="Pseudo-nitzschia fraudulenta, Strain WWA7" /LENGTH=60 /DNA_ID=CAMNT_0047423735 /DNA_START=123 /DNA_END=305 /DNA_ORIENTATION=-
MAYPSMSCIPSQALMLSSTMADDTINSSIDKSTTLLKFLHIEMLANILFGVFDLNPIFLE